MKVEHVNTVDNTTYIMTETHQYDFLLPRMREVEPRVMPIKHVNADYGTMATGYMLPSRSPAIESVLQILQETTFPESQSGRK